MNPHCSMTFSAEQSFNGDVYMWVKSSQTGRKTLNKQTDRQIRRRIENIVFNIRYHQNLLTYIAAVTCKWLEYCRYGVKHYPIIQSINIYNIYIFNLKFCLDFIWFSIEVPQLKEHLTKRFSLNEKTAPLLREIIFFQKSLEVPLMTTLVPGTCFHLFCNLFYFLWALPI